MVHSALEMLETAAVAGAIQLASRAGNAVADGAVDASVSVGKMMRGQSLVSISNAGRVEPVVLLDADCANWESIADVLQSVHGIFAGYYLQAINMLNTVGGVTAAERLAPLSPGHGWAFESHHAHSKGNRFKFLKTSDRRSVSVEDRVIDSDDVKNVAQAANLSIGKMFNVTMQVNENKVTLPVAIRLMVDILPSSRLAEMFTYRDAFDMSLKERYHSWRAGRLSFIKDLVLCNDLIDKYRRMAITDKSGTGQKILDREASQVFRALSGKDSYSTASNIAVISNATLGLIENQLGGRFSNSKVRRSLFENSNLMLLVVIDKQYDRVTIYTRSVDAHTTLSLKDIKASNKSGGPDVAEIMKAYLMGSSPQSII